MKKGLYLLLATFLLCSAAFAWMKVQEWSIGDDYAVKFSGKYADGGFKTLKGTIVFDEHDLAGAKFDVSIDVASINTGMGLKNKHARSEKWFDAEKYPVIHFTANGATKTASGYETNGTLDLHGVKKPLTIPFTFTRNGANGVFNGTFKVNRGEFGIGESKGNDSDFTTLQVTVPVAPKQ